MATGKTSKDIFTRTKKTSIGLEVTPRIMGRPKALEEYQKITVCLYNRQTLALDKIALAIREKTGQHVHRAELIRALVEQSLMTLNPAGKDFDNAVKALLKGI